jgi:hypothetical protein
VRHRWLILAGLLPAACGSPTSPDPAPQAPRWETPSEPLATLDAGTSFLGLAAALDNSTAVVAFGIDGTMWSSQAAGGEAFSAPRRIDTGEPRFARGPALAMAGGSIAAAWEQPDVDRFQGPMLVWANRLSPGTGWGVPALVERRVTTPEQVDPVMANLAPDVAVSATGEAVVVWIAQDVFASASPDGRAWSEPERLDTRTGPPSPFVKQVQVAAGARGRFASAWADGPEGRVAWREPAGSWGRPTSFRMDGGLVMDGPRLAADGSGRALVAWHALEFDGIFLVRSHGVFAAPWSDSSGWGALRLVSTPAVEAFLIDVALDPTGGGAVFWYVREAMQLWLSRVSPDGTWSAPERIPSGKAPPSAAVFLPNGDLLVAWAEGSSVVASRKAGATWSAPETLQDGRFDPEGLIGRVALAANDRGEVLAAWTRYEERSRGSLWTSRGRAP